MREREKRKTKVNDLSIVIITIDNELSESI